MQPKKQFLVLFLFFAAGYMVIGQEYRKHTHTSIPILFKLGNQTAEV